MTQRQPWIHSPSLDITFILLPSLVATAIVIGLAHSRYNLNEVSLAQWAILIVAVDVAHVYSTLYRTYLDQTEFAERRLLYTSVPVMAWVIGAMLYSISALWFWRILAYLAVFHFVRQQYGFCMIYRRSENKRSSLNRKIDQVAIYAATLYPLIYWHTHLPRKFHWFIDGDFFSLHYPVIEKVAFLFYLGILSAYVVKEIVELFQHGRFNLPKNLLVLGTFLSWYVGIIRFNGDLAFTLTNVVAHGIPYMALIWIYGRKNVSETPAMKRFFRLSALPLFLGLLFLLAYIEEGLWDGFIWREHMPIFGVFWHLPVIFQPWILAVLVPLLALPQMTHYVLDGFIWRVGGKHSEWKNILFQ